MSPVDVTRKNFTIISFYGCDYALEYLLNLGGANLAMPKLGGATCWVNN